MLKKVKTTFILSIILCIAFCPIIYFAYKYNVLNSRSLQSFCVFPTPILTGLIFGFFLFLIDDLKLKPVYIAAFGISGALGGLGYHIIEQPNMIDYYPLYPELALVLAGAVYLAIIPIYVMFKNNKVNKKSNLFMGLSYLCGIAYPVILAYAVNYLLYSGQARYYVKEFGSSFSEDPGLWVGAIGYTIIFILFALIFIIVLVANVLALILARKLGMDKKSAVFWWISIA